MTRRFLPDCCAMNPRSLPLALAALALAAAGCGEAENKNPAPSGEPSTTQAQAPPPPAPTPAPDTSGKGAVPVANAEDLESKPKIEKPKGSPPTGLVVKDLVKGKGPAAKTGDMLSVQYVGVLFSTGKQLDASWDRGKEPTGLSLGGGQVIPGWDQGLVGIKQGGRRQLVIPPELAYGAQGDPPDVPPNETLVFVIDADSVGGTT